VAANNADSKRLLFFFLLIGIATVACRFFTPDLPPGEGEKAERGYAACQPIITALENYHDVNGEYPQRLDELVPAFISDFPEQVNGEPIQFEKTAQNNYKLSFSYTGPGLNHCTYSPHDGWRCSGLY
jgi:hypothetical protein